MQPVNHPFTPGELMAYLDGEMPAGEALGAAAHLDGCAECRELADGQRSVSRALPAWEVEAPGERVTAGVMGALAARAEMLPPVAVKVRRKWFGLPKWAWGLAGACGVMVLFAGASMDSCSMHEQTAKRYVSGRPVSAIVLPASGEGKLPDGPMVARTASLQLTTRDFDNIRTRLDAILQRHGGYFGELNIATPTDSGRTLSGKLQVPAGQLDAAMLEIRPLGHVDSESQNGEEVTAAFTDLEARLANARHTEQRMVDLLRERTGKLSDVLEAERELGRVRGEIEEMEAQRKALLKRVDFATLSLTVTEEYKAQLHADAGAATQIRNAAVDGLRAAEGSVVGAALFLLSDGPVLLLWAAILFFPARFAWRRWHGRRRA